MHVDYKILGIVSSQYKPRLTPVWFGSRFKETLSQGKGHRTNMIESSVVPKVTLSSKEQSQKIIVNPEYFLAVSLRNAKNRMWKLFTMMTLTGVCSLGERSSLSPPAA